MHLPSSMILLACSNGVLGYISSEGMNNIINGTWDAFSAVAQEDFSDAFFEWWDEGSDNPANDKALQASNVELYNQKVMDWNREGREIEFNVTTALQTLNLIILSEMNKEPPSTVEGLDTSQCEAMRQTCDKLLELTTEFTTPILMRQVKWKWTSESSVYTSVLEMRNLWAGSVSDLEGKNLLVQMRESDELFNCEKRKDSYEEHLLVESFDELIEYIDKGDDYEED